MRSLIFLIIFLQIFYGVAFCEEDEYENKSSTTIALKSQEIDLNDHIKNCDNFLKYFQIVDTLYFDFENLILGSISRFIFLNDPTKVVIHDGTVDSLVWIDLKSGEHKELTVDNIFPGHKLNIIAIRKDPRNGFWVASYPYYFFKFDENGKALQKYSIQESFVSDRFSFDSKSNILFSNLNREKSNYSITCFSLIKNEFQQIFDLNFPSNLLIHLGRWENFGGILVDEYDRIYVANALENKIYKYQMDGRLLDVIDIPDDDYQMMDKDLKYDKQNIMVFLKKMNNVGHFHNMYFLNNELIIAEYGAKKRLRVKMIGFKNGKILTKEKIFLPFTMIYAGNNHIYLICPEQKIDSEGNVSNPFIFKYEFRGYKGKSTK
ncbi:hypothetical protein H8E88_10500 [candidate division KSB1 bacterium]|nr:hypothetical protein [candidate division KSB1 bacterium]